MKEWMGIPLVFDAEDAETNCKDDGTPVEKLNERTPTTRPSSFRERRAQREAERARLREELRAIRAELTSPEAERQEPSR